MKKKENSQHSDQKIFFPRNWLKLTLEEQAEWINAYYMPKQRIPEPIFQRTDKIKQGIFKTESGTTLKFPKESIVFQKNNPNVVREFERWTDNWLITVFHDKSCPASKFVGISNPHSGKWIAKELSLANWRQLFGIITAIGNKYGLNRKMKPKFTRKKHDFSLSIRTTSRGEPET